MGIQKKIVKWGKRNPISQRFHAKEDKELIATWRLDLDKILHVFNVRSVTPARALLSVRARPNLQETRLRELPAFVKMSQTPIPPFSTSAMTFRIPTLPFLEYGRKLHSPSPLALMFIATRQKAARIRVVEIGWQVTLPFRSSPINYLPPHRLTLGWRSRPQMSPVSNIHT